MATNIFKVKFSKSKDQQLITIRYNGGDNISGAPSLTAETYGEDPNVPVNTYLLSSVELNSLKQGAVSIPTPLLVGSEEGDNWHWVILSQGEDYISERAGFGITLEAAGEVYSRLSAIDVLYHDFRIDEVLHTSHMLLKEMDAMDTMETLYQDREDFYNRLSTLKQILKY